LKGKNFFPGEKSHIPYDFPMAFPRENIPDFCQVFQERNHPEADAVPPLVLANHG